jgi:hypothetical protein
MAYICLTAKGIGRSRPIKQTRTRPLRSRCEFTVNTLLRQQRAPTSEQPNWHWFYLLGEDDLFFFLCLGLGHCRTVCDWEAERGRV